MNIKNRISFAVVVLLMLSVCALSQQLSKEDWQKQVADVTKQRDDLKGKLTAVQNDVANLKKQDADKADALKKCSDELAALTSSQEGPMNALLDKVETQVNDLSKLSNQELWARKADVDSAQAWLDAAKKNPLSSLDKYAKRIQDDQAKIDALKNTIQTTMAAAQAGKTYTVGTWAHDRDCLWNIAKKPKIYDNAFLWPKIWQGNRDQIKNPDVIYRGQKLKIPEKAELTRAEHKALNSYWSKKNKASNP